MSDKDTGSDRAAIAMRNLPEETRNRLIWAAGPKVYDARHWHPEYRKAHKLDGPEVA